MSVEAGQCWDGYIYGEAVATTLTALPVSRWTSAVVWQHSTLYVGKSAALKSQQKPQLT